MCVDDIVCVGAEPLFLLDYVTTGKLDPDQMEQLVAGVADGCRQAGCALLGGEMAEHPGALAPGEFDLAGFTVGVVERDAMLGAERVEVGDVLVGLVSPGLRCNGYTLARHVLLERAGLGLDDPAWAGADHTRRRRAAAAVGRLRPGRAGRAAAARRRSRCTPPPTSPGAGSPATSTRVLPAGADAVVDRGAWDEPRVFGEIRRLGDVDDAEMARVFNLGIGMVLVVDAGRRRRAPCRRRSGGGRVSGAVVIGARAPDGHRHEVPAWTGRDAVTARGAAPATFSSTR